MSDETSDSTAVGAGDEWDEKYRERGNITVEALGNLVRDSLEGRELLEARAYLRARRSQNRWMTRRAKRNSRLRSSWSAIRVAELARAIIVISNLGANLLQELWYLRDAGLSDRVLIYADAQLHTFEEGKDIDEQKNWPLSSDGIRDAVLYAASSEVRST